MKLTLHDILSGYKVKMHPTWLFILCLLGTTNIVLTKDKFYVEESKCPQNWVKFEKSCYRFIKSPIKAREDARRNCQVYQSDLVAINSLEEHGFILQQLLRQDPQHRQWYTGIRNQGGGWTNEADGTQLADMDNAFLPEPSDNIFGRDYLAYSYHNNLQRWGLKKVTGIDKLVYICEAQISTVHNLVQDDRTYEYGVHVIDPLKVPRGPYFIRQPVSKVFDVSNRRTTNEISLSCLAGGYPTPTYEWFKEEYESDRLIATKIDPLLNIRYTISGGTLIIYDPEQVRYFYPLYKFLVFFFFLQKAL